MIVHLLTDVGGRRSFIVQGVRSGRGKGSKAALFQPLFTVEFEGLESTRGELHRFAEVRSGMVLRRTPFDVKRSTVALFIAEVLYRLIKESDHNETLFERVWSAIAALDTIEEGVANFHLWFLANLSRELGFMPSGEYRNGYIFDIQNGIFRSTKPSHQLHMSPNEAELLNTMLSIDVEQLGDVKLNRTSRTEFLEALIRYYSYHLDDINKIHSIEILRELF